MEKLDRLGWVVSQVYRIGDQRVEIRTTSTSFAEWVDHVLGAYRTDQDFEDQPYFSVVVQDGMSSVAGGRRFHILYRRAAAVVRTLDLGTLARSFLSEIERLRLPYRDDAVHVDAAIVQVRDADVLVPGYLVPMLSSLGRRADREGIRLPGHSTLQLDDDGTIVPLAGRLDLPADALSNGLSPQASAGDRLMISRPLRADAILQLAHEPGIALRQVSKGLVVHRLATQTMNLPRIGGRALVALGNLTTGAACLETTWMGERAFMEALARASGSIVGPYVKHRSEDTREGR